jgi:hypothetical protein
MRVVHELQHLLRHASRSALLFVPTAIGIGIGAIHYLTTLVPPWKASEPAWLAEMAGGGFIGLVVGWAIEQWRSKPGE